MEKEHPHDGAIFVRKIYTFEFHYFLPAKSDTYVLAQILLNLDLGITFNLILGFGGVMKKLILLNGLIFLLSLTSSANAIPSLQLDILGGVYDSATQTMISTANVFTLEAYLIPDSKASLDDTYFISAAVFPQVGPPGEDLGSFSFNGQTIGVTSGMDYGAPPIESLAITQPRDSGDLQTHDIFPTYFTQFGFKFNSANRATAYDTQEEPGLGPTPNSHGHMYYASFSVDTSLLSSDYFIHFDLYNTTTGKNACSDIDIKSFAPFSHDAQSGDHQVPEPATFLLLGSGLLGFLFFGRRTFDK